MKRSHRYLTHLAWLVLPGCLLAAKAEDAPDVWSIRTTEEWKAAAAASENLELKDGMATPTAETATFTSVVKTFDEKRCFSKMTLTQSSVWHNWEPIAKVAPTNLQDAPVFLAKGPQDYWIFGMYHSVRVSW